MPGMIDEIANWKLEAKREDNDRYFWHQADVDSLVTGENAYVIGRKGTGKTAISEYIRNIHRHDSFATKLSFRNFPFNDLYAMKNDRFNYPNQYITLWKLLIYNSVCSMMAKNESLDHELLVQLRETYRENQAISLSRTVDKWTSAGFGLNFLGLGGANVNAARNTSRIELPWIERVNALEEFIDSIDDDSFYYVLFDELDEDYREILRVNRHDEYVALLTSLFKAVQDVRSVFSRSRRKIFPIVFLRDDIYGLMMDADRNKWSDFRVHLDWPESSVQQLLAFRIARASDPSSNTFMFDKSWKSLFRDPFIMFGGGRKKRTSVFEYITRSTLGRPRDYVSYLRLCCIEAKKRQEDFVSADVIRSVDKAFSNYLREEFEDEISAVLPDIKSVLGIVSRIRKQYFSFEEFKGVYSKSAEKGEVEHRSPEFVITLLFFFSIIGNQPRQRNNVVFRYQNREANLNVSESCCVHRGLFKSLQIL